MISERELDVLLVQYKECFETIRHFDSLIWQVPSLTMAINTFLGIMYLGYAKTFWDRIIVLLAAFFFTLVSTIALEKHRFFQEAKLEEFKRIQNKLLTEFPGIPEIKFGTENIFPDRERYPTVNRRWIRKRKAFDWLSAILYLSLVSIGLLIFVEIIMQFYTIIAIPK